MAIVLLGQFVLNTARGTEKRVLMPEQQSQEVRVHLSTRVNEKVEEIRAQQRRAYENVQTVTVF